MRIAFNSVAFHRSSLETVVPLLCELGYEGIELNAETLPWAAPHVAPTLTQEERHHLRQLLTRHKLPVSSLSAHINLIPADACARRDAIGFVKGCIDLACDLDTSVVHGLTGSAPKELPSDTVWGWLLDGTHECLRHAGAAV